MARNDLEARLVRFAIQAVELTEELPKNVVGVRLKDQLTRAATSTALNYGEAQSAESRKDFIHKLSIALKELRESKVALSMVEGLRLSPKPDKVSSLLKEANELIAIFVTSVQTARRNDQK